MSPKKGETGHGLSKSFQQPFHQVRTEELRGRTLIIIFGPLPLDHKEANSS
ncbi:hypothetical protein CSKR_105916 [Clonorchis sinensis]|uniref:Uncharacterized protein n=1 Tax=Clonorchis sinensis TaxID=79923 RepID=A0A419QH83_CLOSI|nr:hypothetical protein CSKR_105916 [Clonorchis sinensis]